MSASCTTPTTDHVVQLKPYRRSWFKSTFDSRVGQQTNQRQKHQTNNCTECWGSLHRDHCETYCRVCGLVHCRHSFWQTSLRIEARRRQFNHNSEDGSGTLQYRHTTIVEDSAANTTFDGGQLDSNLYSLDQYNDGRDGHQISDGGVHKLNRHYRFLRQRAEACATTVGLSGSLIREVTRIVASYNSGAYTSYGPEQEGGGQDAHIIAAIVYVGNRHLPKNPTLVDISNRMEKRDQVQSLARELGMEQDDVRGAVSQLHRQLR